MDGWFRVSRKLMQSDLWLDEKPFTRGQAWVDLIGLASFKDAGFKRIRGVRINVKRGQVAMSLKGLGDRWGWSKGKVKRFLDELKMERQTDHKITNVTCLISITNYDSYQSDGTQMLPQTERRRNADGTQTERKRNANGPQTDPIERKEGKRR